MGRPKRSRNDRLNGKSEVPPIVPQISLWHDGCAIALPDDHAINDGLKLDLAVPGTRLRLGTALRAALRQPG